MASRDKPEETVTELSYDDLLADFPFRVIGSGDDLQPTISTQDLTPSSNIKAQIITNPTTSYFRFAKFGGVRVTRPLFDTAMSKLGLTLKDTSGQIPSLACTGLATPAKATVSQLMTFTRRTAYILPWNEIVERGKKNQEFSMAYPKVEDLSNTCDTWGHSASHQRQSQPLHAPSCHAGQRRSCSRMWYGKLWAGVEG